MKNFDRKNRNFYQDLPDELKKKFSTFLMIRYGSSVKGSPELEEWYLRATNERLNMHYFDLSKHPNLLWLLCTTVSPALGDQFHEWIGLKKKASESNKTLKFLKKIYPNLKEDELQLLATVNSRDDIKSLARELGYDDATIKAEL